MRTTRSLVLLPTLGLALLILVPTPGVATTEAADLGYGFYRIVEGRVLLTGLEEDAEPLEVEPNYPLMTGDRVWVDTESRLEVILPDRSKLRLGERTEIYFESLAGASDSEEGAPTSLRLLEGDLQLEGQDRLSSTEQLFIDTANADLYLDSLGTYRVSTDGSAWTEVVVRGGFAEITTERGSVVARDGDRVLIEGSRRPEVSVLAAGDFDALEIWGEELMGRARHSRDGYVDDSLAYVAAPLRDSGAWVSVSGRHAWRPTVRVGWRPFYDGWWATTPSGLSWVPYESWGWVTAHYGAWDYVPGWGWLWFPGQVYSPAWVYWYWGPSHTAWIPSGYYTRYYGPHLGFDFRFGVYGWAGGYWDAWSYWTFCPTRYFGRRSYRPYWRSGHDMSRHGRHRAVPRGIVTTDTRGISRGHFGKPTEIYDVLERRHARTASGPRELPDVSDFVARRSSLGESTRQAVRSDRPARLSGSQRGAIERSGAASAIERSERAPWTIDRPERRAPERRATSSSGFSTRGDTQRDDWELIERLRRFENKQEELPRSPRLASPGGREATPSRFESRRDTPTRSIVESLRSRQSGEDTSGTSRPTTSRPTIERRPTAPERPSTSSGDNDSSSSSGSVNRAPSSSRQPSSSVKRPPPSRKPSSSSVKKQSGSSSSSRSGSKARKRGG